MEPINNDYHSDQLLLLPLPLAYRYLVGVNPPTQKRSLWKLCKNSFFIRNSLIHIGRNIQFIYLYPLS